MNIKKWWNNTGKYLHHITIKGFKNLYIWFPTIWNDRDYDQNFIYQILKVKLKNQARYIGRRDRHTRASRDAKLMMLCANLIQKCQDDFYTMEYMDYHKTDINFIPIPNSTNYKIELKNISENFDNYFSKYPLIYKKAINGELKLKITDLTDKSRIALVIAHENQDRARKLLFKILYENIEGFWD